MRELLRSRDTRLFFAGQTVSIFGELRQMMLTRRSLPVVAHAT